MSHLQRAWAKSKVELISADPLMELDEEENDGKTGEIGPHSAEKGDDDSSSTSSVSSTSTVIPKPSQSLFARPQGVSRSKTLEPIPWTTYFEREFYVESDELPGLKFHVYLTSPVGKGPLFVAHHGAGSSGLSFAVVSSEIRNRLPSAGILAVDCRDHGSTVSPEGTELDLRLATLSGDLHHVILLTQKHMGWQQLPPIILVGHSLGGVVVTDLAHRGPLGNTLLGYAVLDVVEGSAIDSLKSMQAYLSQRPGGFSSVETAIEWHVRSRTIRNVVSARASVPALVRRDETIDSARPWRWRTNLAATQAFWEDWVVGSSKKFLSAKGGKLLLLAGTDRLDTELTIGQMQGKFTLQVLADAGHFLHEDSPEQTAAFLCEFYKRNDRSLLVLPPKMSDLLKKGQKV